MNYFTQQSIELANQRDYLAQPFTVYPLTPDSMWTISESVWDNVESLFRGNDNIGLFNALLGLELFPIKDGYVPCFKLDRIAINRNPRTVNRICKRIRELGIEKLYEKCTQPKETNRQMGPLFKRWINTGVLGVRPVTLAEFTSTSEDAILDGTDKQLKIYASKHLGYTRDKGVDFFTKLTTPKSTNIIPIKTKVSNHKNLITQKLIGKLAYLNIKPYIYQIKTSLILTNMLFANKLKELREKRQLLQRQLASALEIDTPMYSRIERGERKAKREQVILLAKLLDANEKEFLQLWLADKVYDVLAEEDCADGVINMVAENIREYGK